VHFLDSLDVVQVAAGNEHTAVLTRSGHVYTAGYNDNGQCGQGHQQRVPELAKVKQLPKGKKATQVHAYNGCEHTMIVTEDGKLYSFGYNYRGQLGHGTTVSELVPRPVKGLEGKRVRLVSCSYYHTVVTTDEDEAYSFGRNDFGQVR
jgi:RCC1 and BTB domain-containing protein